MCCEIEFEGQGKGEKSEKPEEAAAKRKPYRHGYSERQSRVVLVVCVVRSEG